MLAASEVALAVQVPAGHATEPCLAILAEAEDALVAEDASARDSSAMTPDAIPAVLVMASVAVRLADEAEVREVQRFAVGARQGLACVPRGTVVT